MREQVTESRFRLRIVTGVALVATLACTGCQTVFYDSIDLPGSDQRLVVGQKAGFLAVHSTIWVVDGSGSRQCKIKKEVPK